MSEVYLTKKGYHKLLEELEILKTVRRRELSKAIGEARLQGDISENAEYDAAKEAQGLNEKRIAELEQKLANARVIEDQGLSSDEVLIGAKLHIKDLDTDEEFDYTLVSEVEADYSQGLISVSSPVGSALLGHKQGDVVEITVPAGKLHYKIIIISRE